MALPIPVKHHNWLLQFFKKERLPDCSTERRHKNLFVFAVHLLTLILIRQPVYARQQPQITDTITHQRTIKFERTPGLKLKPIQKWVMALTGVISTKDTVVENVFNGQPVSVEQIISVKLYNKQELIQVITGINESARFDHFGNEKIGLGKLEDYNHDGYADLWICFLPYSRLYDSDFAIYLYDPKKKDFDPKKYYLLKDLSEKELKKKLRGDEEN